MIDETEKPKIPSKFAKHAARYNEFGCEISINVYFIRGNSTVSRCIILQALAYLFVISKLEHYGVRGTALRWFKSYLSNRQQYVEFNGISSESCEIKCGVSQGSLLGPLLFLLYINDLCNVSKVVDFILSADDTNIFFSHKDFNLLPEILNSEMLKLTQWCRANKLSINFKKSNLWFLDHAKGGKHLIYLFKLTAMLLNV